MFSNYRPISILPAISKILEKIMYNRLFEFIDLHGILSAHQYGFRPKRSTYVTINDLYCKITSDLNSKFHTLGIFLDLSKAFDTLNHDILLHNLDIYGIRGLANIWIKNYLADRKQHVVYNRKSSTDRHMNFLGELKHPCRHDAQNDSEVRKITHTFSIKKNISTTIYSVFFLQSLIERYLSPLFNEVIFRFLKKIVLSWYFCLNGTQVCIFLCVIL